MMFSCAGQRCLYCWTQATTSAMGAVETTGINLGVVGGGGSGVGCQVASHQPSDRGRGFSFSSEERVTGVCRRQSRMRATYRGKGAASDSDRLKLKRAGATSQTTWP